MSQEHKLKEEIKRGNEIRCLCAEHGFNENTGLLCGWDWEISHRKDIVEARIEIISGNGKIRTIISPKPGIVREVMKIDKSEEKDD
jgi:hypothetical protein